MDFNGIALNFKRLKKDYWREISVAKEIEIHAKGLDIMRRQAIFDDAISVSKNSKKYQVFYSLFCRHLYEDDEALRWRILNLQAITKPSFSKAFNSLARIFKDSGFSLNTPDFLTEYLDNNKFCGLSFNQFFSIRVLRLMIEDPNAYLAWIPTNYLDKTSQESVGVKPELICSEKIYYKDEDTLIWLSNEYCDVETEKGMEPIGLVYYALTASEFIKISQVGERSANRFVATLEFKKLIEDVPFYQLKGEYNSDGYYRSFFDPFIHFANEALKQFSDTQYVFATCAYPIKEIGFIPCDETECANGYVQRRNNLGDFESIKCNKCQGTGQMVALSGPTKALRRAAPSNSAPIDSQDLLKYITPDVAILTFMKDWAWELLKKAEDSLHINFVEEAQSGTAKAMDREELYSFLNIVSLNYFELMEMSLDTIQFYTNPQLYTAAQVIKPTSFKVETEDTLKEEVSTVKHDFLRNVYFNSLIKKSYSGDATNKRKFDFLIWYDPLFIYNNDEKDVKFSANLITEDDYIKSVYSINFIQQLISDVGEIQFTEMTNDEIVNYIQPLLDSKVLEYESNEPTDPNESTE